MSDRPRIFIDPQDAEHCREVVRSADRDRYLCALFAPEPLRPALFAAHAFVLETLRLVAATSEPTLARIRLQWWRDGIEGVDGAGEGGRIGHPVLDAVRAAIAAGQLGAGDLERLLDAREHEIDAAAPFTLDGLERHLGQTEGVAIALAARVLGEGAGSGPVPNIGAEHSDLGLAASHGGIALGLRSALAGLTIADPGRMPQRLPADLTTMHGLTDGAGHLVDGWREAKRLRPLAGDIAATVRHHLERARAGAAMLDAKMFPAFLPLATVEPDLNRLEADPLAGPCGPLRRQFAIYRAARSGRL